MSTARLAFALWCGDPTYADWLRTDAGPELESLSLTGIRVNIDDQHVAAAQLRLSTFDVAPDAFVFATTAPGAAPAEVGAAALTLLRTRAARVEGWRVETVEPLVAPAGPAGERDPGLANVALIRRRAGIDDAEFVRRWQGDHTAVAIATQDTCGYVQNRVVDGLEESTPELAAIVEETFPMAGMTDLHAFYGSGGDDAELSRRMTELMESVSRFADDRIDVVPTSRYRVLG